MGKDRRRNTGTFVHVQFNSGIVFGAETIFLVFYNKVSVLAVPTGAL